MTFTPSPQLAHATYQALRVLALHRPRVGAFRIFLAGGDDAQSLLIDWARALLGVSLEAIPEAASRWMATREAIPTAAAFAAFARKIDYDEYRNRDRLDLVRLAPTSSNASRSDALSRRAREQLGSTRDVARVWDWLLERATTDAERQAIRDGVVSDERFAHAMRAVLSARTAPTDRPMAVVA